MQVEQHGTARQYRRGCRCSPCRAAESKRKRDQRIRKLTGQNVVALPTSTRRSGPGDVELGVLAELESVSESHPAMIATAVVVARILDDDRNVYQHPQAARQLQAILSQLHGGTKRKKDRGRLASVQSLVMVGK